MSSKYTQDRMTLTYRKNQGNNMKIVLKLRKRSREDGNAAGSSSTKTQGRSNINQSTDPSNMKESVSVRKRTAGDAEEMARKRMRRSNLTSPTKHCEESVEEPVEDRGIKCAKRKVSVGAGPPTKKTRHSTNNTNISTTEPSVTLVEDHLVEPKKRKTSDNGEAPVKKRRCSSNSSLRVNLGSFDDEVDVSQNWNQNTITEEERIFEMSSPKNINRGGFKVKYCQLNLLGEGGYGSVYDGFRKSDRLPVAIKHIPSKDVRCETVTWNGKVFYIILEVALMLKATGLQGPVGQSAVVSLLDWYMLENELVLVMEQPAQSLDLQKYLRFCGGSLDEHEAKIILKQLVDAAIDMHSKGVFHRDIKLHNVLIQMDSDVPRVRIIDFGCSTFSTDTAYHILCGTRAYFPPEWLDYESYWARTTTVWQLGAIFYCLLHGGYFTTLGFINRRRKFRYTLSTEVKTLLYMCLSREPFFRATLEDLQRNPALRLL